MLKNQKREIGITPPDEILPWHLNKKGQPLDGSGNSVIARIEDEAVDWLRLVRAVNCHAPLVQALLLWRKFFDEMPKGQFHRIVCNIGTMNDAFIAMDKALTDAGYMVPKPALSDRARHGGRAGRRCDSERR